MSTTATTWVGQILAGRYRVTEQLGEGGMAVVYRAQDRNLHHRDVVIKVPRAALLLDAAFKGRFAREIRSLVGLEHKHVVEILDAGEHDGLPFMVVRYLSRGSLRSRQRLGPDGNRVPQSPQEVAEWLRVVAEALDFIHAKGAVHRDVKPDNILFDGQGHVYLGDFGIAKTMMDDRPTAQ